MKILYFRYWFDNSENPDLECNIYVYFDQEFMFICVFDGACVKKEAVPSFFPLQPIKKMPNVNPKLEIIKLWKSNC